MKTFKELQAGESIYRAVVVGNKIEKADGHTFCTELKIKNTRKLTDTTLDITFENGQAFFPYMNNKAHTTMNRGNAGGCESIHTVYGVTEKDALEEAQKLISLRLEKNRAEQDKLKASELELISTMTDLLEEYARIRDQVVSVEQFATMAL